MTFDEFKRKGGAELSQKTNKLLKDALSGNCSVSLEYTEDGRLKTEATGNSSTILLAIMHLLDDMAVNSLNRKGNNFKYIQQRNPKELMSSFDKEMNELEKLFNILRMLYVGVIGAGVVNSYAKDNNLEELHVLLELIKAKNNGKIDDILNQMKDFEK